ncbi:hypothetical protein IHE55_03760 [Streptomyces pactum]|uniref:Uncharacterized protein n=1 Tax=Streptomyces pactum TaxID=68249 RepID=A0ABS0NFQ9_9ACTN|nr:hypothetical protein [Streptomyces pactum]MBH5333964.1 hypothetical protein [Streptomyces pactum]
MTAGLTPVIAATTRWLVLAYPSLGGPWSAALAEAQARQAVTAAAWLRYPTAIDVELVRLLGPGGSGRLDRLFVAGADGPGAGGRGTDPGAGVERADVDADAGTGRPGPAGQPWRSWVDEVVASWAACLLTDPALAGAAVAALDGGEHTAGGPVAFPRLTTPDRHDRQAARLLRDPGFLAPVADLHRSPLTELLGVAPADPV